MVAAPPTQAYGRLSVALQTRFRMKKLFNVSKGAFRPPPKVESAVVSSAVVLTVIVDRSWRSSSNSTSILRRRRNLELRVP